jgi:hypothetical protein
MVYPGTLFIGDNGAFLYIPMKMGAKFEHCGCRVRSHCRCRHSGTRYAREAGDLPNIHKIFRLCEQALKMGAKDASGGGSAAAQRDNAAGLKETGPLSQGVQAGGKTLRIRYINGMEVRKKRPRGFKKRPRGFK